jgi:hypothetical protein
MAFSHEVTQGGVAAATKNGLHPKTRYLCEKDGLPHDSPENRLLAGDAVPLALQISFRD